MNAPMPGGITLFSLGLAIIDDHETTPATILSQNILLSFVIEVSIKLLQF